MKLKMSFQIRVTSGKKLSAKVCSELKLFLFDFGKIFFIRVALIYSKSHIKPNQTECLCNTDPPGTFLVSDNEALQLLFVKTLKWQKHVSEILTCHVM